MRRATCWTVCILLIGWTPLTGGDKDKPKDKGKEGDFDVSKLVGQWMYVSGEKGGAKVDEKSLKDQKITITKDTWTLKGEATFVMKYEVDAKKNPVAIKFTMTESPFGAGAVAPGIIEIKGDEIRVCYNSDGKDSPKKFETKDGDKMHLFVLKRTKAEKPKDAPKDAPKDKLKIEEKPKQGAAAPDVTGAWKGTWGPYSPEPASPYGKKTDANLDCNVVAKDGVWQATFEGECGRPYKYTIKMDGRQAGSAVLFKGTTDLGEKDGGVFDWIGRATDQEFVGFYTSAKYSGVFRMARKK